MVFAPKTVTSQRSIWLVHLYTCNGVFLAKGRDSVSFNDPGRCQSPTLMTTGFFLLTSEEGSGSRFGEVYERRMLADVCH